MRFPPLTTHSSRMATGVPPAAGPRAASTAIAEGRRPGPEPPQASDDFIVFYRRHYRPGNLVVSAVGDFEEEAMLREVEAAFGGDWGRPPEAAPSARPVEPPLEEVRVALARWAGPLPRASSKVQPARHRKPSGHDLAGSAARTHAEPLPPAAALARPPAAHPHPPRPARSRRPQTRPAVRRRPAPPRRMRARPSACEMLACSPPS